MTEAPTNPATEPAAPAAATQEPPEGLAANANAPAAPPWGNDADFDPEKAWERIQKQARDIDKMREAGILTPEQKAKLAEFERLEQASKTELERAQEAATQASERIAAITRRAVEAEAKALAASTFADPSDAAAFLDLSKYADQEGGIDTETLKADLADVLQRKPHLARAEPADPRLPKPNPAQGGTRSASLDDLISEAQGKGDFKSVIHLQNQKLASQNGA